MKKYIYLDLFHLSLVLSLLRLYPNLYRGTTWDIEPYGHEVFLGDSSAYTQTRFHNLNNNQLNGFVHPKNIDDALERTLFIHDINSLYRRPNWNSNLQRRGTNVFAYIVNELQPQPLASTTQGNQDPESSESQSEPVTAELTQEEMDLIEILWKQDIDLGVSRDVFDGTWKSKEVPKQDEKESNLSSRNESQSSGTSFSNPWHGLNYSIDSETGEHIALPENTSANSVALVPNNNVDITLEEALSFFEIDNPPDDSKPQELTTEDLFSSPEVLPSHSDQEQSLLDQLQELQDLVAESQTELEPGQYNTFNPSFLDIPPIFNETNRSSSILDALLQNTSLALPMDEPLLNDSYPSAGSFEMEHDTNINILLSFLNDTDPHPIGAVGGLEQNELLPNLPIGNLTTDTSFLTQLVNEDNIDFSDFCDTKDSSHRDQFQASTSGDSAVSSMGSDWSDSCSLGSCDSNMQETDSFKLKTRSPTQHSFRHHDWTNAKPTYASPKKYHLFGKNEATESQDVKPFTQSSENSKFLVSSVDPDEKYNRPSSTESCSSSPLSSFSHNHTYHYNGDAVTDKSASHKPLERDKPQANTEGILRGSRDEKRLRYTNLPLSIKDIVELPIELFNERLEQLSLSDQQLALVRDIRRRGKNKMAARNCRKRKIDQISDLQVVIDDLLLQREFTAGNLERAVTRRDLLKQKYERLYRFIYPDQNPPDPLPASNFYFPEHTVTPPALFPASSNGTSANDSDNKKRGKHKGVNNKR